MAIDKRTARRWLRDIRDVLNRDWDPIGDCPEDEYESYAGQLASMVQASATDEQILKYLEWAEVEHMGLGQHFDRNRGKTVIAAIRALKGPWSSD